MANFQHLKLRAYAIICLAVLSYPTIILIVVLHKLYRRICCRAALKSIAGEIAVVTGGAYGLGKDIAIELALKGCHIAIADIDIEQAKSTADFIRETFKVKTKAYKVDVTDHDQVLELSKNVTTDFGVATILINNAGIVLFKEYGNPTWLEVKKIIDTNLTSHFSTQQAFLPKMKEQRKGHIVAISSISSFLPFINNAEYTATKFGIRGLTRVLRLELKIKDFENIHVTTVFPCFIDCNPEEAARVTVNGMLRNEKEIMLPSCLGIFCCLIETLPACLQDWILVAQYMMSSRNNTQ